MQYLGGKYRLASKIRDEILARKGNRTCYVEPFMGGASVFVRVAPHFNTSMGSDKDANVMELWSAVRQGWEPPTITTKSDYERLRTSHPSAERAWYGYALSYGGKFFGGFIGGGKLPKSGAGMGTSYEVSAQRALSRDRKAIESDNVSLRCCSYLDIEPLESMVIYCDPPYSGTTGYHEEFNSEEFWQWCEHAVNVGALVLVSEYSERAGWVDVAPWGSRPRYLNNEQSQTRVTERLLVRPVQAAKSFHDVFEKAA